MVAAMMDKVTHFEQKIKVRDGHSTRVSSISASTDGSRILSLAGATVKLWDSHTKVCLLTLKADADVKEEWLGIAISPNGKMLCTCHQTSSSAKVQVRNAETGKVIKEVEGCTPPVAWSQDSKRVVSGTVRGETLHVWDAETGEIFSLMEGHTDEVKAVAWSPDGKTVCSGSSDKTLRLWNAETGESVRVLEGHTNWVYAVAWSPDGKRMVSGSLDKTVRVWDAETGECVKVLEGHTDWVFTVAWSKGATKLHKDYSRESHYIVSGSRDKTLRVWDAVTGECVTTMMGHARAVRSVVCLSDGSVVSGSYDTSIRFWNATTGAEEAAIARPTRDEKKEWRKNLLDLDKKNAFGQSALTLAASSKIASLLRKAGVQGFTSLMHYAMQRGGEGKVLTEELRKLKQHQHVLVNAYNLQPEQKVEAKMPKVRKGKEMD